MKTADILVAYTLVMMYAAARAKRKVAELINSFGSAVEAKSKTDAERDNLPWQWPPDDRGGPIVLPTTYVNPRRALI
jgi:hypothetical protein